MKKIYDQVCLDCSVNTTKKYSTSFSLGIYALDSSIREHIYSIYGLVRFADEIVDTFHGFDKEELLVDFKRDCFKAIEDGISLNPILQAFQLTVNRYEIDHELIHSFFRSMEMDLNQTQHDMDSLREYIVGSAEVVGLMCLHVFVDGDKQEYTSLKAPAERLGSAFQKVNFLRDLNFDSKELGRRYFPQLADGWNDSVKQSIEADIQEDFDEALKGILRLPGTSKLGVYLAYKYYLTLFRKIRRRSPEAVLNSRIRISNGRKIGIMLKSFTTYSLQIV